MPVTRDEVIWAYRMILGRNPENEQVVADHLHFATVNDLRAHFLDSREFHSTRPASRLVQYLDVPRPMVQVDCTPAEQKAMFERIAGNWRTFGETEPHWSVLTNDIYRSDRIEETIDHFYQTGVQDVEIFFHMAERAGVDLSGDMRALDFGCGTGRLTLALAARFREIVGLDVSAGHLKLARERAAATGTQNARFEAITEIADLDKWRGFDFILSRIVLQHNPPPIMAALLEKLLLALNPGGTAVIQIPTYIHGQRFEIADYLANEQPAMEMNALPQDHVFDIIARTGCRPREVREDDSIGHIMGVSQIFVIGKL